MATVVDADTSCTRASAALASLSWDISESLSDFNDVRHSFNSLLTDSSSDLSTQSSITLYLSVCLSVTCVYVSQTGYSASQTQAAELQQNRKCLSPADPQVAVVEKCDANWSKNDLWSKCTQCDFTLHIKVWLQSASNIIKPTMPASSDSNGITDWLNSMWKAWDN